MYRQQQELEEEALHIYVELDDLRKQNVSEEILYSIARQNGLPDATLPTCIIQKIEQIH